MVAPITGPFSRTWTKGWPAGFTAAGTQSDSLSRVWRRQKAPYDQPLPFTSDGTRGSWLFGERYYLARNPSSNFCWISTPTKDSSNAYNNAWSEFDEKMRGQAEWAVNLLQYRQSYDALVKHTTDLYRVFRNLRQGRLGDVYHQLKLPKGFKLKGKSFADKVLELRFGWLPLWGDIHSAAESLGRDLGDFTVVGKGQGRWRESASYVNNGSFWKGTEVRSAEYRQRYRLSADVKISNPNLLLWDSLGLTNPYLVAYEMIPFSFVFNYFISLEEFCRGLSPYMGLSVRNSCTTHFTTVSTLLSCTPSYIAPGLIPPGGPYKVALSGWTCSRSVGPISGTKVRLRDPWILQPGRGINCVALLLQQLARKRG